MKTSQYQSSPLNDMTKHKSECVTIGHPSLTHSCHYSYMWWVVYVLSPAAARGGAISADSQQCALHQPCTCYSSPFSYLFRPMPSVCVGVSFVVCLTCCCRPPLSHLHSVSRIPRRGVVSPLASVSGLGARDGTPVHLFLLISFLFCFGCCHPEFTNKLHSSVLLST